MTSRQLRYAEELLAFAIVYVVAARAGLKLDAVAGFAALVWAPTGIALAVLLIRGYHLWPGVLVGAIVANLWTGAPAAAAVGMGIGNTLEALIGVYALSRIPGFHRSLDRLADVFGFILFAAVISTAVSATIGVSSLYFGGIVPSAKFAETWRAWWLGDLIGDLLVAPVILVWTIKPRIDEPGRLLEAGTLFVSLVAVSLFVFGDGSRTNSLFGAYLFFPFLIWASVRFGQRGSVTTAFIISVIAVWGTVAGSGPFVQSHLNQSLFALQTFMAITTATFLVLGASISERRSATEHLEFAILEQERLLAERDDAHRRLVAVLEATPLAIEILEAPGGKLLFVNDEAGRLMGKRPTTSKVQDPFAEGAIGFHPDGSRLEPDEWPSARALRKGEVVRDEIVRIKRSDGHNIEVMINAAPVRDGDGRIVASVVISADVTEQRKAEAELRRAHEAAAQANRAKSEFLAVMSHELRTPLNAIGGHVQLIEMEVHGPISDAQREALVRVQRSQRHLLSLINDLLNLVRIETGHVEYELDDVSLESLVAEVKAMIEPLLSAKRLTCLTGESPYAPEVEIVVRADREKLQQILLNLLTNAIKFTPEGGRISVEMGSCPDAPSMTSTTVSDSGVGIPESKLESIFEPFVQLATRPVTANGGLGLGLSISRDLARGMGGDLKATSKVGEGSKFILLMPRTQDSLTASRRTAP